MIENQKNRKKETASIPKSLTDSNVFNLVTAIPELKWDARVGRISVQTGHMVDSVRAHH